MYPARNGFHAVRNSDPRDSTMAVAQDGHQHPSIKKATSTNQPHYPGIKLQIYNKVLIPDSQW